MAIIANFTNGSTKAFTESVYQYDKGQRLILKGIEIGEHSEIHFSNEEHGGIAIPAVIQNGSALIPNGLLETGKYIYAWLYAEVPQEESQSEPEPDISEDPQDPQDPQDEGEEGEEGGNEDEPVIEATDIQTLYEVVIPVITRPLVVRPHYPTDGEGMFAEQYTVEDETLIFIKK